MKRYNLLIYFFTLFLVTSSDPFFGAIKLFNFKTKISNDSIQEYNFNNFRSLDKYLLDHDDRVDSNFKVNDFYLDSVRFWFLIYTQFSSSQVLLHDKDKLSLIYSVIDFSSFEEKKLGKNTSYILQQKVIEDKKSFLRKKLLEMGSKPDHFDESSKKIFQSLSNSGLIIPVIKSERLSFFTKLANNLRSQTGQKNFIFEGIHTSLPFEPFLVQYFTKRNLPLEILSIPFLESSFNPNAQSKVNALGAWQFMPFIAQYFLPKRKDGIDYRRNVGLSSVSAAFLMEQNFKILKSWDLAITAYNSGTKHLVNLRKKISKDKFNLIEVIQNSNSKTFGFASKNFYSEFLALVHTMAYRKELFNIPNINKTPDDSSLHFFVSKCDLVLSKILKPYELNEIDSYNHHFFDFNKKFHRGLILNSSLELPKSHFFKIPDNFLISKKPIDWLNLLKNQSCSTK